MNRELWLSQVRENVRRHNKREREFEVYGEPSELIDRKDKSPALVGVLRLSIGTL